MDLHQSKKAILIVSYGKNSLSTGNDFILALEKQLKPALQDYAV